MGTDGGYTHWSLPVVQQSRKAYLRTTPWASAEEMAWLPSLHRGAGEAEHWKGCVHSHIVSGHGDIWTQAVWGFPSSLEPSRPEKWLYFVALRNIIRELINIKELNLGKRKGD